jgi:hypothetical protein
MRRREFVTLLGGAAVTWPFTARAQQSIPVIGYLSTGSRESDTVNLAAFRQGLGEIGYVEGQNVTIEYRWAESHNDRLSAMADDLVRGPVTAIAAIGGTPPGTRGQGGDIDDSGCFLHRYRPGRVWARCQLQPAWRKYDGRRIA